MPDCEVLISNVLNTNARNDVIGFDTVPGVFVQYVILQDKNVAAYRRNFAIQIAQQCPQGLSIRCLGAVRHYRLVALICVRASAPIGAAPVG